MKKKKVWKVFWMSSVFLIIGLAGYAVWIWQGKSISNPMNAKCIGDINTPFGYERISADNVNDANFTNWLRALPLKSRGTDVMLYTGGKSRLQSLNYAVVDMPLISNDEQCADVCMRLRAEYLYSKGLYGQIRFENVSGKTEFYGGGRFAQVF